MTIGRATCKGPGEVQLSDENFRLLVESVQDYAIYLMDPDGTILSWNAGGRRLKGYTAEEIVGRKFSQFFTPEDRASGRPARLLQAALRDGRIEDIGWRVRKDGTQFWASAVITTLRDRRGQHIGFAKVTRDLTDRAYRAFVEATHAIVWTTDATGHPNADSPTWREFTGQTEAEWRGLHAYDPVHPEDVAVVRACWERAKAEGAHLECEFRLRRRDGEYLWMVARAIPFLDSAGNVREWFGVTFDVEDRKRAEQETERALALWRTTLRSLGDAVLATDSDGAVRFMNPIAEKLTGWTELEAAGRPLREVLPIFDEETGEPAEDPVARALSGGAATTLARRPVLRGRAGSELAIDLSAAPIRDPGATVRGVVVVFRDVTEERRELLRRAFLVQATELLVAADDVEDALARVAQLAVPRLADFIAIDMAGPSSEKLQRVALVYADPAKAELASELRRRYPPDPSAQFGTANVIRTGRAELYPEIPRELIERLAHDEEYLRLVRALDLRSAMVVPLRGRGAAFGALSFALVGTARRYGERDLALADDIARRAGLVLERRRAEEAAERANRMKDEFLATMSHELRTPLHAILGYASMLERGLSRDPGKAIAAIIRNAHTQTRLVEDMLDVSRITSGKLHLAMRRIELAAPIRAALESTRPAAVARRIRIVERVPGDLGEIRGDPERLQQVVWNLLSNAVKFTDPGGTIEIAAVREGSAVRLTVSDTGKGIPRDHLDLIFERFRQLDSSTTRSRGGLGLGLAIVRYLVEAHGGTVAADSAGPGAGSTFTVTLPVYTEALAYDEKLATGPHALEGGPLHGVRVLIVEDDDDARELLADVLSDAGAEVTRAASAAEAFSAVEAEPPQVMISDVGMPIEDGYSLMRRIRALPPERGGDIPAIALTAYARPDDVRAAAAAGFQLHVVKPVRPDQLLDAIRSFVRSA